MYSALCTIAHSILNYIFHWYALLCVNDNVIVRVPPNLTSFTKKNRRSEHIQNLNYADSVADGMLFNLRVEPQTSRGETRCRSRGSTCSL